MIRSLLKNPGDPFEPTHAIHFDNDAIVVMAVPEGPDSNVVALYTEEEWPDAADEAAWWTWIDGKGLCYPGGEDNAYAIIFPPDAHLQEYSTVLSN